MHNSEHLAYNPLRLTMDLCLIICSTMEAHGQELQMDMAMDFSFIMDKYYFMVQQMELEH